MKTDKRTFSKYFYNKEVIAKAIRDYQSISRISVQEKDEEFECLFETKEIPVDLVICEFGNYLIELLNGSEI